MGPTDPGLRAQLVRFAPSVVAGTTLLLVASQTSGALQTWLWVAALAADYIGTVLQRRAGGCTPRRTSPNATD